MDVIRCQSSTVEKLGGDDIVAADDGNTNPSSSTQNTIT